MPQMPGGETQKIAVVGTSAGRIAVRDEGSGRPALLLLHGSSFSKEIFEPLIRQPSLSRSRRVAIDLPGHGGSDDAADPHRTYSVPGLAAIVREVLAALGLEGCVLLGWSLGGDVAMQFLGPEPIVSGVALVSAPPVPGGILGKLRGYRLTGALLARKSKFTRRDALRFERQCIGKSAEGRFVGTLQRTDPLMRPRLARAALIDDGTDQRQVVRSTDVPVWLVAGAHDPLLRIRYVRRFRARTLHGDAAWIVPEAGHAPFLDRAEEFAAGLAEFVQASAEATGTSSRGTAARPFDPVH